MGFVSKSGLIDNTATQNKEKVTPDHSGTESSRTAFDREIEVLEKGDDGVVKGLGDGGSGDGIG